MPSSIHHTAIIGSKATLGNNVEVGPFAVIEDGASLGDGCVIESHAVIKKWAQIDRECRIGHFCVVGGNPQHLEFDIRKSSFVKIGKNCRISEGVTIHRSIHEDQSTKVGENVYLMGNAHVAHDCLLSNSVILANGVLLGGHVEIGDNVFIGGGAGIHQFVRVGSGAMIGGLAEISQDVGPNLLTLGRNHARGLNRVGLKRRKVPQVEIDELKKLYREILCKPVNVIQVAKQKLEDAQNKLPAIIQEFLEFYTFGKRGFARHSKK
jgi:UDP-N-acetylglucosamine acyltransferase